jgi:hypothetical protein
MISPTTSPLAINPRARLARTPAIIRIPQSGHFDAPASSGREQAGQGTMLASTSPMANGGDPDRRLRLERRAFPGNASMVMVIPFVTRTHRAMATSLTGRVPSAS